MSRVCRRGHRRRLGEVQRGEGRKLADGESSEGGERTRGRAHRWPRPGRRRSVTVRGPPRGPDPRMTIFRNTKALCQAVSTEPLTAAARGVPL